MTIEDLVAMSLASSHQMMKSHPSDISFDNDTNTFTITKNTPTGIVKQKYILEFEGDEITGLIFPDGSKMTLSGF